MKGAESELSVMLAYTGIKIRHHRRCSFATASVAGQVYRNRKQAYKHDKGFSSYIAPSSIFTAMHIKPGALDDLFTLDISVHPGRIDCSYPLPSIQYQILLLLSQTNKLETFKPPLADGRALLEPQEKIVAHMMYFETFWKLAVQPVCTLETLHLKDVTISRSTLGNLDSLMRAHKGTLRRISLYDVWIQRPKTIVNFLTTIADHLDLEYLSWKELMVENSNWITTGRVSCAWEPDGFEHNEKMNEDKGQDPDSG
ncbi:hypothetical protein K469DRAFT_787231 [Zopfia rhizophila CBS 207.26]|uniref:Uncharacterized protein n=1 Tax=Zopfia rhizophila CBS 207.26 TaxID=1314779 RepID=A0A6A6DW35_9PEZI|nr:hypothetical protein K469DRAFT_787231 [Zopfia rhizophila CBS 207.26]